MSGSKTLSGYELDDLRNWAQSAVEDDAEDEFPPLILRLLQENAELRELLHREHARGALTIVEKQAQRIATLENQLTAVSEEAANFRAMVKTANALRDEAQSKVDKCAAVMLKVEELLAMARSGVTGATPESLASLATRMEEQYLRDRIAHQMHQPVIAVAKAEGKKDGR